MRAALLSLLPKVLAHPGHHHGASVTHGEAIDSIIGQYLFPYSARVNALLATVYISAAPCLIVIAIPELRKAKKGPLLSLLMSFAFGTLMGDIILHLLPEIFSEATNTTEEAQWLKFLDGLPLQDSTNGHVKDLLVTLKPSLTAYNSPSKMRTTALGLLVFCGFVVFMVIDKGLKIANFGSEHDEGHHHGHSHIFPLQQEKEVKESVETTNPDNVVFSDEGTNIVHRSKGNKLEGRNASEIKNPEHAPSKSSSLKASAYLSLVSAFAHNITDGIALASAFYKSKHTGIVTTLAVLMHEIPHELGDFAILLTSGIKFNQALFLQLVSALGALIGTLFGCIANEMAANTAESGFANHIIPEIGFPTFVANARSKWPVSAGELMLPITTGGLLFISTVGVVPELLRITATSKKDELTNSLKHLGGVFAGFALMAWMGLNE
ncbi:LAQU0S10e03004g1_1 [Lachancea quebecensis]|uniref:LAQU0S10e03004g1_1 n=1 Tax=Lachancea quebecensis TaxID=1654605 RepID=A0A0P1KW89_9SACH|nr:LAQU0S10e03004g1_1 [Lachancea quebecensis]